MTSSTTPLHPSAASARKAQPKLTTLDKTRIDDTRIKIVRPLLTRHCWKSGCP
jgi:3-deoxy-7-phosphoheptulonate synthase